MLGEFNKIIFLEPFTNTQSWYSVGSYLSSLVRFAIQCPLGPSTSPSPLNASSFRKLFGLCSQYHIESALFFTNAVLKHCK